MKLLFISAVPHWGGSEFLWQMAAKKALEAGFKVIVSVDKNLHGESKITELITAGADVHFRRNFKNKILQKVNFKLNKRYPMIFSKYSSIDFKSLSAVIVSQGGSYEFCFDLDLHRHLLKYKIAFFLISQYHEEFGKLTPWLYEKTRKIFPLAKKIYFVSKRNRELCEMFIGQRLSNAVVINNPLRLKNNAPLEYPIEEVVNFACVARLDVSVKGQNLLLMLLSQEKWRMREWKLTFFGNGQDFGYLTNLVFSYALNDRVEFKGHVEDIKRIWQTHHLLLLPSESEGCALALIEAFECGRTAVVTDVGGHEELVINGKTGFLAPSYTIKNFGDALEQAWTDKHKWNQIGVNAFYHLREIFDADIEQTLVKEIISDIK